MIFQFNLIICILYSTVEASDDWIVPTPKPDYSVLNLDEENEIIPFFVNITPKELFNVTYENQSINIGILLSPEQVLNEPKIKWKVESKMFYSLFMVDPYLLTSKNISDSDYDVLSWLFWSVVNIPEDYINKGHILAKYDCFVPPLDSKKFCEVTENSRFNFREGLHHYFFLLYKQTTEKLNINYHIYNKTESRRNFDIDKFTEVYNLSGPVAATYFKVNVSSTLIY